MAKFRITSPDGRTFDVNAPEGATQDDVMSYAQKQFSAPPTEQPKPGSPLTRTEKIAAGAMDPIHGGAQLLTKALPDGIVNAGNRANNWLADKTGLVARVPDGGVDRMVRDREQEYQARRTSGGESGFDGYRVIGNVLSPANIALARAMPVAGAISTRMGMGAAGGAASGLVAPVTDGNFSDEKLKQAGLGAVFGGITPAVTGAISRAISPKASINPDLKLLKGEGVKPTLGQTLGGLANSLEEKAQSIPVVGDLIARNRLAAREQFNNAAINRATAPINQKVSGAGTAAVKEAGDLIGDAYTKAKSQLGSFRLDQQGNSELSNLRMMASSGLEGRERSTFNKYFKDYISQNRAFTPEKFKELDSKLTSDIAKFGSGDAYQQKLGDALKEIQRAITENAKRANPQAAKMLSEADAAYANLVRVEGASVGAKGADGIFTPGQLLTAVRGADKSVRDRSTARGTALMQDLASAGQNVLGNKVPDSGTAGRLLLSGGLGAAGMTDLGVTAGLLGTGLAFNSAPVQSLLRGLVSSRPELAQPVADALRKASPGLIPAGAQVGLGLLNN